MKYIITQGQLHSIVYDYLNKRFDGIDGEKKTNPYPNDSSYDASYHIDLKNAPYEINYIFLVAGEDDEGNPHSDISYLYVSHNLILPLVKNLKIRETKVLDIITDWFSEKYKVDVDYSSIRDKKGYY